MNLTGLLLGAGASFDIGMPLVKELHRDLKRYMTPDKLQSRNLWQKSRGVGVPDEAIEVLVALLHRYDLNYEHTLSETSKYAPIELWNNKGLVTYESTCRNRSTYCS